MTGRTQKLRDALRIGRLIAAHPAATTIAAGELPPLTDDVGLRADAAMVVPANGQVVFRMLGRSAARLFDFQSARDRARPPRPGQDFLDYVGLSMFAPRRRRSRRRAASRRMSPAFTWRPARG